MDSCNPEQNNNNNRKKILNISCERDKT